MLPLDFQFFLYVFLGFRCFFRFFRLFGFCLVSRMLWKFFSEGVLSHKKNDMCFCKHICDKSTTCAFTRNTTVISKKETHNCASVRSTTCSSTRNKVVLHEKPNCASLKKGKAQCVLPRKAQLCFLKKCTVVLSKKKKNHNYYSSIFGLFFWFWSFSCSIFSFLLFFSSCLIPKFFGFFCEK